MNYYEVKIYTSTEGIEPLSGVLIMLGHDTFVTEDKSVIEDFLEKKNQYDWDYVDEEVLRIGQDESNITIYMETDETAMHRIEEIKAAVAKLKKEDPQGVYGRLEISSRLVCDDDWKDRWKQYFKPARITDSIVVKPSWETYEPGEGDRIIEIDPGMAFGTGTHPTTKMCIRLLEKYIEKKDDVVLDLGCGSGILSVAAALCGSEIVRGVDIDPDAAAASLENAEKNHLSDRIEIRQGDVTEGLGFSADIIVANLIADLIIGLSDDIAKHLSGKKIFISSGILAEKCDKVVSAISDSGFEVLEILEEKGWCAVAAQLKG